MKILATPLNGLFEIESAAKGDTRGRFSRLFCEQELSPIRIGLHFTQINLSETAARGTIRGMHYQLPPSAEAKLIKCIRGKVFDVAVDLRQGSETFLQWRAVELSDSNDRSIFIPEGFAHGFQALTENVQMLYMHTASWAPDREAGLHHDDPQLAIKWPQRATVVSEKDSSFSFIDDGYRGLRI